jgi:leucyl/phenylalanyl-tRNA--protein transferase
MLRWLNRDEPFPAVSTALADPDGLLAAGGDLAPRRLLDAYRRGIFPWYSVGQPVLWWSPDPRMVLFPSEFKISRSLRKSLRNRNYEVRVDTAFEAVMRACAAPRTEQHGTWINAEMVVAYGALYQQGLAHSIEIWINDRLAGGLYGIALGRVFYGESMFAHAADASKIALAHLVRQFERWQFGLIDCQVRTRHLATLGAREIPRRDFIRQLAKLVNYPDRRGRWQFDDDLSDDLIK